MVNYLLIKYMKIHAPESNRSAPAFPTTRLKGYTFKNQIFVGVLLTHNILTVLMENVSSE